jgi:hypothetical protein
MERVIKLLVVMALIAVILVASISPALARPARFGKGLDTGTPCRVHLEIPQAQHGRGAQLLDDPDPPQRTGCWVVLPGQG